MRNHSSETNPASASWHELLERLTAHFGNTAQNQCLLWVDPAQADPFAGSDLAEQLRVRVPIRHPRFDPVRAPYLVPLDLSRSADADLFAHSVALAWRSWSAEYLNAMHGQPICGWVSAATSATTVARYWAAYCHLHTLRRQTRLLRFQDPGVREWLWPTLDNTQQRGMLGPVNEMLAIGRSQQLIHHGHAGSAEHSSSTSNDASDSYPKLRIEQDQWDQLDDYATLHAAWRTWRSSTPDKPAMGQAARWERPILRALAQASQHGIRDAADRELFALHALQSGPDFHRSPKLEPIWPLTLTGDFYGSAIESVLGCPADQLHVWMQGPSDSSKESVHDRQPE